MYCRVSRVWSASQSPGDPYANSGSRLLAQILEHRKLPFVLSAIIAISFIYFGIFAYLEFQNPPAETQALLGYGLLALATLGIVLLEIPILIWPLRLMESNTWIAVFLAGSLVRQPESLEMGLLLIFGLIWIGLRIGEAHLWRKVLALQFESIEKDWSQVPAKFANQIQKLSFALGLFVSASSFVYLGISTQNWVPHPSLALVMVIFTTPFISYLMTAILKLAEQNGWLCRDFSFFRNLRKSKILFFHSTGVLSSGALEVKESWIETSNEWPKEDIREILTHLSHQSAHPISDAIRDHFAKVKKPLLELEKTELHPHLGVTGIFRDIQRSKVTARLGSFSWHRVLQSEMSDEGREHLKKWLDAGRHICLLSLNETIVCGLAFTDEWNDLESLNSMNDRQQILLTSTLRIAPHETVFSSKHYDSFPAERQNWQLHWTERIPQALEIAAWWDTPSEPILPRIHFQTLARPTTEDHKLVIYSHSIGGLHSALKNSESFHRQWIVWLLLSGSLGVAFAYLLPPLLIFAPCIIVFHGGALLWTRRFAIQ